MKLDVKDRLIIQDILPQSDGLVAMRVIRDIREKVMLTQGEMKLINLRDVPAPPGSQQKSVVWDTHKTEKNDAGEDVPVPIEMPTIEVEFTRAEMELIKAGVNRLDKIKKVTLANIETCEKFLNL